MIDLNLILLYLRTNAILIIAVFLFSFVFGLVLGFSTVSIDREKKKKGFKMDKFATSYEKKLDKKLLKESKDNKEISSYLHDDQEYFANKKFK